MTGSGGDTGLDELIDAMPIGLLVLDRFHRILQANLSARQLLGCEDGESLHGYVRDIDAAKLDELLRQPGQTRTLQFDLAAGSKTVEATSTKAGDGQRSALFISDVSEKVALGRQLKSSRQPSKRLLYQLHSTTTNMAGYAELIDLMLEEEPAVTGERLNVIRRYHKEIRKNLETLVRLLKVEREGGRRPDATAIPMKRKQVVVIDDEPAITEVVSELMKGLQYRVAAFTEPAVAMEYCEVNGESIDLVIVDHTLPGDREGEFTAALLSAGTFPVVLCSEDADRIVESARTFLCHKPIDITELTRIVSDLI